MIKKVLIAILLAFVGIQLKAQNDDTKELNCYNKWSIKFEERGAEEVADGVYTDVIVTIRIGPKATCFSGKAEVAKKKLTKCYIVREDGTYEEIVRTWKNESNKDVDIINGMSESMISVHNELINVLWPKKILPKKAAFKKAPEPTDD